MDGNLVVNESLNLALNALQSTSKGNLKYDGDWRINENTSSNLSCSFESYLNDSIDNLTWKLNSLNLKNNGGKDGSDNASEINTKNELNQSSTVESMPINHNAVYDLGIKLYENQCRQSVEKRTAEKAHVLQRRMEYLKRETETELKLTEDRMAKERIHHFEEIKERKMRNVEEMRKYRMELDEKVATHGRRLNEMLTRSLKQETQIAEEEERRALIMQQEDLKLFYNKVLKSIGNIKEKFSNVKYLSFIDAEDYEEISNILNGILAKSKVTYSRGNVSNDISDVNELIEVMQQLIKAIMPVDKKVDQVLSKAQKKGIDAEREEELQRVEKVRIEQQQQELKKKEIERLEVQRNLEKQESETKSSEMNHAENKKHVPKTDDKFSQYISEKALIEYTQLQDHLNSVQASFKEFIIDPKNTKYKFDIQKAVNNPINALSAHSPQQLNDKIRRLVELLKGNNVEVGGKHVNCKGHPCAMAFCQDLVAKKLVMQGAQQVSSNPESAFLYSAVIVGIWSVFPDVGKLILAHFYRSYPYLVPYYMPQLKGQTNQDYYKALGYSINNNQVEDENHFLKKFSGTVQLYAAVVSSKGATLPDHPHGIGHGWTWMARTVNLKPHPNITATMLFEFIKVCGHLMMQQYRKQFQKLLLLLCKEYLPAIENVTPIEKQGPTQRFKDFLQECIKMQRIALPKGYLTERWWQTGHF